MGNEVVHIQPSERQGALAAREVMATDLASASSRARARQLVDSLGASQLTDMQARVLDRRFALLAQADSGGARAMEELERLAVLIRGQQEREAAHKPGFFAKLLGAGDATEADDSASAARRIERLYERRREIVAVVDSLVSATKTLRQNHIALDGFATDIARERERIDADIAFAEDFATALEGEVARAKQQDADQGIVRFAEHELLFPLTQRREYLLEALAVNQQAELSLAVLRQTNERLVQTIAHVTQVARESLDLAVILRRSLAEQEGALADVDLRDDLAAALGTRKSDAPDLTDFMRSFGELTRTLEENSVWRQGASAASREALVELQDMTAKLS